MEVNVKMEGILFSGIFWGIVVILFGVSIIVNAVFNVHIPFFRVLIAVFFIYIGIMVLSGGFRFSGKTDQNTVLFSEGTMQYDGDGKNREFNVIFGKGTTQFSGASLSNITNPVKVNAIFGEAIVEIDPSMPVIIRVNAAFGAAYLPDQTVTSFGEYIYKTPSYGKDKKSLEINASVVFGAIRFVEKKKGK